MLLPGQNGSFIYSLTPTLLPPPQDDIECVERSDIKQLYGLDYPRPTDTVSGLDCVTKLAMGCPRLSAFVLLCRP